MNTKTTHAFFYLFAFLFVCLLLLGAQYLETYEGVSPCPLCILQRLIFAGLGIVFLIGIPLSIFRMGRILAALFSLVLSSMGIALAARQVWLQSFPTQAGANCEVSLNYMMNVLPLKEVISKVLQGGSTCSQVGWSFLNFSLAQWSLVFFIVLAIFSLFQFRR